MNNINNIESGERLSFYKLFKEKKYKIVIPIIQRDYAQGRKREKEIRDTFLDALFNYLDDNKPNRDLDFIYGTLNKDDDIINFTPLDGQQRLTTLFLLHWYLYQISDNKVKKTEFKNSLLKNDKSLFSYETRISSSDFCDALMGAFLNINEYVPSDKNEKKSLSKRIKNCPWYYLTWEYDPTIQAMLTMLDAIHEKFSDKKVFLDRLLSIEKPIITFLFLNLEKYNLTDDLYIKMNSRGKPLTPFENFKAKLEQYLEKIETKDIYRLSFKNNGKEEEREVTLKEYFSHNIDTKWANLFWQYSKLQNSTNQKMDNTFDNKIMNFIRVIFTNQYTLTLNLSSKEKDNTLEYLLGTKIAKTRDDYSDIISFNKYQKLGAISIDSIRTLIDVLDELANGNKKIENYLSGDFKFYFNENTTFENVLKHDIKSYHERLMFFAYIGFLLTNINNRNSINQWMRTIHNLTHPDNTIIDSATNFSKAIVSIENLLTHSNNILDFLKSNSNIDFYSSWQILEEKIKAHLILKNNDWKEQIIKIEQHKYFNGQIGFILEFAGIVDYYTEHKNCDWSKYDNETFYEKFCEYANKASIVFTESYEDRINNKDFVFERAVLTKGNYLTSVSHPRYNLLSTSQVKNNIKRDHSWKRLLRKSNDQAWKDKRNFVKQVFDDARLNKSDITESLESICKDSTNDWRDYFINCHSLISYCEQGFIRFKKEHNILLYRASTGTGYHVEMYTYYLWKKYVESNKKFYLPFQTIYYEPVKGMDKKACIIFNGFTHNRINYKINIFYDNDDEFPNPYEIKFFKSKGDKSLEKYGDNIKTILNKCGYEWHDKYEGYFFTCKDIDKLIEKLKETTELLQ